MKRQKFLKAALLSAASGTALSACRPRPRGSTATTPGTASNLPNINWQMATSWPTSLDTIYSGATFFADRLAALTNNQFKITPRAAGEIAPPLEVLSVVSQGGIPCGHTAGYYYIGKTPAVAFGTSVPFGLNAQQQNAWLYEADGLKKLQDLYARKFGVIQFPCGNTGPQMGGWFRREINSLTDLKGLKMRIPGLGGKVMGKLGVTVQTLPGSEIFSSLQTGAIDAAEWVGPYDDEKLGIYKVAKYYYYPGWWEPGPTLELQINLKEWERLPKPYQAAIETAAMEANTRMLARYDTRNNEALDRLLKAGVQLRTYSPDILAAAEKATFGLLDEFASQDTDFRAIYEDWRGFRDRIYRWNNINEGGFVRHAYGKLKP